MFLFSFLCVGFQKLAQTSLAVRLAAYYCYRKGRLISILLTLYLFSVPFSVPVWAQEAQDLPGTEMYQRLGQKLDLSLSFTNQNGQQQTLKDMLSKDHVLLFTLNYYRCPTMCTFQFLNLAQTIQEIGWPVGPGFRMASFSFDPSDTVTIAKQTHDLWVPKTGQPKADWNFYVGDEKDLTALTKSLNFFYEKDDQGLYSHAAALFFVRSDGTFYRYLYGIVYNKKKPQKSAYRNFGRKTRTHLGQIANTHDGVQTYFRKI